MTEGDEPFNVRLQRLKQTTGQTDKGEGVLFWMIIAYVVFSAIVITHLTLKWGI